jgi:hypothetical protein
LKVHEAQPRPTVSLCETSVLPVCPPLALVVAPSIPDSYEKPPKHPIYAIRVEHWHATLEAAHRNTFAPYFRVTGPRDPLGLAIELLEVDFELVPTATFLASKVTGVRTQLRYKARLVDGRGEVLATSAASVSSKESIDDPERTTDNVASALESMYEQIARDLFPKVVISPAAP